MQASGQTPKVYQNHRDNQRERILESAEMLFIRDGIDFALLGDLVTQEYGQPMLAIYQEICRVFLRGLQSKP